MKAMLKKMISMVVVVGLLGSQIGCAGKIQPVSKPLEQVKLPENHTYTIKLKTQEKIRGLQTQDIDNSKSTLKIKTSLESKSLRSQDIDYVYGVSNYSNGNYLLEGLGGGALIGTGVSFLGSFTIFFAASLVENSLSDVDDGTSRPDFWKHVMIPTAIGAGVGAIVGGVIGFNLKKKNEILITPTVEPTSSGVNAGVNVGIQF